MNALQIHDLSMHAGTFQVANISLTIPGGEYFTLMGRTGSGKSLLLKAICGLAQIEHGRIEICGQNVTALEPRFRNIGYVPQNGGLFPHLNVGQNILFPLCVRGVKKNDAQALIQSLIDMLGLAPLLHRAIAGLSGGERQKVALARALACQPQLLILDEPVCALDEPARYEICDELRRVQRELKVATLHICHSRAEAEQVSDRVGVMHDGRLIETGPLQKLLTESGHDAVHRLFHIQPKETK